MNVPMHGTAHLTFEIVLRGYGGLQFLRGEGFQ
jgi:hypothetical protein